MFAAVGVPVMLARSVWFGSSGWQTLQQLTEKQQLYQQQQVLLTKEHYRLLNKQRLLQPDNLDADLVAEILRQQLYWMTDREYMVLLPK